MLGALTLIAFYGWWSSFLPSSRAGRAAFALACFGATFDLGCEAVLAFGTSEIHRRAPHDLGVITTVFANGLYCVAGVILTLATPALPRWLRAWSWAIWITGFAMTAAGLADSLTGIKVTTAVLTILLCPWFLAMGRFLNRSAVPA
jgi:alkylation response protein AidB-like acyl-CoA dehydrogenase